MELEHLLQVREEAEPPRLLFVVRVADAHAPNRRTRLLSRLLRPRAPPQRLLNLGQSASSSCELCDVVSRRGAAELLCRPSSVVLLGRGRRLPRGGRRLLHTWRGVAARRLSRIRSAVAAHGALLGGAPSRAFCAEPGGPHPRALRPGGPVRVPRIMRAAPLCRARLLGRLRLARSCTEPGGVHPWALRPGGPAGVPRSTGAPPRTASPRGRLCERLARSR
mmetsp:Transcript_14729/g.35058  ORF Transcript_14729/g.35058 Transcript_14729/m.35058 type:complete len:221 (+) Transcript_14729:1446-2108(+)